MRRIILVLVSVTLLGLVVAVAAGNFFTVQAQTDDGTLENVIVEPAVVLTREEKPVADMTFIACVNNASGTIKVMEPVGPGYDECENNWTPLKLGAVARPYVVEELVKSNGHVAVHTVMCKRDDIAIAGGYRMDVIKALKGGVVFSSNGPHSSKLDGWQVEAYATNTKDFEFIAYAICTIR